VKSGPENDSLLDDVLPPVPAREDLGRREFQPWHRPRKQLIRLQQWRKEVQRLIDDLRLGERPFAYFTLPGEDLLDIRVIAMGCHQKGVDVRYLGINAPSRPQLSLHEAVSQREVLELPNVRLQSKLIPDRFETVVSATSLASRYIKEYGTFDALNIDLCDSVASPGKRAHPQTVSYFDAIHALVRNQIRRTEPWLLFLTTRCTAEAVHDGDLEKLCAIIDANVIRSGEFRLKCAVLLNAPEIESGKSSLSLPDLFPANTRRFALGVGKWLLSLAGAATPQWEVSMLPSYHYRVSAAGDMLSIAVKFVPQIAAPADRTGLSAIASTGVQFLNEEQQATKILDVVLNLTDLDQYIAANKELRDNVIDSAVELLAGAGYDGEGYLDWVTSIGDLN
jgi:hypothetical protein